MINTSLSYTPFLHVATGALREELECGVAEVDVLLLVLLLLLLLLLAFEFSEISVSALILRQVVAPSALAKWSSTEPVKTSNEGSFCDLMAFHVESPSALAKWSSTDPVMETLAWTEEVVEAVVLGKESP